MEFSKNIDECLSVLDSFFFNESPMIGFIWRNDKFWSIKAVSKNVEKILGYSVESFLKKEVVYSNIIHHEDITTVINEVFLGKQKKSTTFSHKPYRLKKSDGNYIWVKDKTTILYNSNGDIDYFVGYIIDCTSEIQSLEIVKENEKELINAKNELEKSRQMWIDAIERNGDGLWEWNLNTNEVYFSTQWKKMLGYEDEEISNNLDEWKNKVHPDDINEVYDDINEYLKGNTLFYKNIHRVLCKDRSYKWILDRGSISEYDKNGKPLKMVGTHRDMNIIKNMEDKRKLAQIKLELLNKELLEKELKLKNILHNIPDLVWIKDPNGRYILCNKRFEELYGQPQDKIIGKTDYDFIEKNLADSFRKYDQMALKSEFPINNVEELKYLSDGHIEISYVTKTKILKSDGSVLGVLGVAKNVTELREKQKQLQEQKEEFKAIFDNSIDGLAILDLNSNFLDFNDSYLNLTGFTRQELLKKSCLELSVPEDLEKSKNALLEILKTGYIKNYEKRCLVKNNKIVTINLSAVLLSDKKRILLSTKDITDTKLLQTQSKLASMGEMIGNIAHQYRQPLSVISTIASGISVQCSYEDISKEDLINNMKIIVEQTQYLSKTIDDFKNFIKPDENRKSINISSVVEKTISILKATLKNNDITLVKNLDEKFEIFGYENEFIQALINIINNAKDSIVHSQKESKRLIILTSKKVDDKYILQIQDSGTGIDENIIDRIFEPYFTTKYKSQGTGIGLSMTYKILKEHHNASIVVSNQNFFYEDISYYGASFEIIFSNEN